jgi:hypothetical protein
VLFLVLRICDEGALEELLVEVGDDGMGNLYPIMPFDCGVRAIDPSCLADPAKLEQI